MKKVICCILFFLFAPAIFSQAGFVNISGVIKRMPMSAGDTAAIEKAEVTLKINDTLKLMTLSNEKGRYEFKIQRFNGSCILSCKTTNQSVVKGRKNPCIMQTSDTRIIDFNKPGLNYAANFSLREGCCLLKAPELFFKANSLDYETDSLIAIDKPLEILNSMLQILNDNPTVVMELDGHCDAKEKNKKELSLNRAELVRQFMLKNKIPAERIKTKGFEDTRPFISETVIRSAQSNSEREALRARNQRLDFRILSFDYGIKETQSQSLKDED